MLRTLRHDVVHAVRTLRATPGFAAAALLSLAVGIGATTAIFSVASALLLRPLPYPDPGRLVILWNTSPGLGITEDWFSTGQYFDIKSGVASFEDVAVVPTFDIPGEYIDQSAREFRFDNGSTGDDHGIHVVGHMRLDGHDWFLIKDSNRSSRHGRWEGYYFYRDDYVRLKMLTYTVHKDDAADILARVDAGR
jgi:hypothetical protein